MQHWLGKGLYIECGVCNTAWEDFVLNVVRVAHRLGGLCVECHACSTGWMAFVLNVVCVAQVVVQW